MRQIFKMSLIFFSNSKYNSSSSQDIGNNKFITIYINSLFIGAEVFFNGKSIGESPASIRGTEWAISP